MHSPLIPGSQVSTPAHLSAHRCLLRDQVPRDLARIAYPESLYALVPRCGFVHDDVHLLSQDDHKWNVPERFGSAEESHYTRVRTAREKAGIHGLQGSITRKGV